MMAALRRPGRGTRLAAVAVALLAAAATLWADTVLVPEVSLEEGGDADYVLQARLSPSVLGRIRPVSLPPGCAVEGDPVVAGGNGGLTWTLAFRCPAPLDRTAELYLPWTVDGVRVTATWSDGSRHQGLFGRDGPGIVVPLRLLMDRDRSLVALAGEYGLDGARHAWTGWAHVALAAVLVLTLSTGTAVRVLAGLSLGHALSLPAAELGARLPAAPAEALVGAAALVLAATLLRPPGPARGARTAPLLGLGAVVGVVHGLGAAGALAALPSVGPDLVSAHFLWMAGLDLMAWAAVPVAAWGAGRLLAAGAAPHRTTLWWTGSVSAWTALVALSTGFAPPPRAQAGFTDLPGAAGPPAQPGAVAGAPDQLAPTGGLAHPFLSYLTVEPYQVRHEVLASARALAAHMDVPADPEGRIPVAAQEAWVQAAAGLVAGGAPLQVDGAAAAPARATAAFVTVEPTGVLTRVTPVPEPLAQAVLGITLVYETPGLPGSVDLSWQLFVGDGAGVPVTLTDPATVAESRLSADAPGLQWRNTLGDFTLPEIDAIRAQRPRVPMPSLLLALAAVGVAVAARRRGWGRRAVRGVAVALVAAYVLYPFARVAARVPGVGQADLTRGGAAPVLEGLLANVYRSFDIHDEEAIYDRLALTVTGEQLLDVYLESRRALELENRGGARVRIDEVVVRQVRRVRPAPGGGYELDAVWTVGGSVTHFGHEHFRQNRYDALIRILPVDGTWKIAGMELLEERRLM